MEHQVYKFKQNHLMQDSMSAMKMEKNGQNSCTGDSRHINIIYLFVMDRVDKKEIEIVHCPNEVMLADYFTNHYREGYFIFLDKLLWYRNISVHCTKYLSRQRSVLDGVSMEARIFKKRMWKH